MNRMIPAAETPAEGYFPGEADTAIQPRLIEKWFPVNQISTESIRERSAASALPPVNWLHVWWARRPLAPSRASVLLSLLPQSADSEQTRQSVYHLLGTSHDIHETARRLAAAAESGQRDKEGYGARRRAFTHNPTSRERQWLNDHLADAVDAPLVLDVTAGGGSIPFEAGRLGLPTVANELNPVAGHILRATCQWPQQYGYPLLAHYREISKDYLERVNELVTGVYPEEPAPDCAGGDCPHPQAACAIKGCQHNTNTCSKKLHRAVRAHRYAQTYLWARTAACLSCQRRIPLSPNWRLDNKGTGIRLDPAADPIGMGIVHHRADCADCRAAGRTCHLAALYPDRTPSSGTVARAIATCPACGSTTPKAYLAQEAQAGRMGHRLYCIVYRDSWYDRTKAGKQKKKETTCRVFAEPGERHFAGNTYAAAALARLSPQWEAEDVLPNEALPEGNKTKDAIYYGMPAWSDMFNPRQQLAHGHCVQAFRQGVEKDRAAGRLDECRQAAWGYIAIALDKMINNNNLLCRWHPNRQVVAGIFDTHDFGFKWNYSEMAIICRGLGLEWALDDIDECLSQIIYMVGYGKQASNSDGRLLTETVRPNIARPSEVIQGDARDLPLDDASVDCIVFDPPYEQNVCFAELSDFFYVWLKRTAGYVFPANFAHYLTEKEQEAIASPVRFRNRADKAQSAAALALADYQRKMAEIFAECRRVIKRAGVMVVMFNHKSTSAWDALTVALIEAGFTITRTWPVKTEAESSLHIKGKAAARTTLLLVCRPRVENLAPEPWHEVEELIAEAVRKDIAENLSGAALRPIDLYLSAFGPALRIISRHWGARRDTPNPARPEAPYQVTPTDALQVARREVSRHRAREISERWSSDPVDAATRFYVLAKDAAENDTLLFDEANLLARALGVPLEKNDPALKRMVRFNGDKVQLLSARDRLAARNIEEDRPAESSLDAAHTAVALTDRRNTGDAGEWLTRQGLSRDDPRFKATLEALARTTRPGHDDYQAQRNLWQFLYQEPAPPPAGVQLAFQELQNLGGE